MATRPSRPIPIPPPRWAQRAPGAPSFPGPGVDLLAFPQTQPSFPARSDRSHAYYGSPSSDSLLFSMDTELPRAGYSAQRHSPAPLYDLPAFARPRTPGHARRCRRCGRVYSPPAAAAAAHAAQDPYSICPRCRDRAAAHVHERAGTMLATDYIPARHRSSSHPIDADVLQPNYSAASRRPMPDKDSRYPHEYQQRHDATAAPPASRQIPLPTVPASAPQRHHDQRRRREHRQVAPPPPPPPPVTQPSAYLMSRLRDHIR